MATSNRKSAAFVLTREGKSSIFKQNDGISLNLTRFALFKDDNKKLKDFLRSVDYDYTSLENLTYDFFAEDFTIVNYNDSLVATPRLVDGEKVLCLNVDIFNKDNIKEDQTYDGIIYFCDAFDPTPSSLSDIAEEQKPNTIFAIQYFDVNKITIQKNQDERIKFVIQVRFSQKNYEVIDLKLPDGIDNGLRIYNDALSNKTLKSKTIGTNRSFGVGNNQAELGSLVDIYADLETNQLSLMSLGSNRGGPYVANRVDTKFSNYEFKIDGKTINSVHLFSKDNTSPEAAKSIFSFSNVNELNDKCTGNFTFINSNNNTVNDGSNCTFISTNNVDCASGNNVFIGSTGIQHADKNDAFIASQNLSFANEQSSDHNTFINCNAVTGDKLSNFVTIGDKVSKFINIDNGFAIGHDLNVGSADTQLKDIVIFGKYNAPILTGDIFVLAAGNASKGINVFKVDNTGSITLDDGDNSVIISPTGIGYGGDSISYTTIIQVINYQQTLNDINGQLGGYKDKIERIASNGLMNITFILDVDNVFDVDVHVPFEQKQNNLLVTLNNPFENEVTVTYKYKLKDKLYNPETEVITVNNKETIQLMYINNDDYQGFVKVR